MCDLLTDPPNCPAMVAFLKASDYCDELPSYHDIDWKNCKEVIITPDDTWGVKDYQFILECLKEGSCSFQCSDGPFYDCDCPRDCIMYNPYF